MLITFWLAIISFFRGFKDAVRESRQFVYLLIVLLTLILIGVIFYMNVEGWNFLDSLFFVIVTITTVGYGNLVPETKVGIVFTIVLILMGIGLMVTFLSLLAKYLLKRQKETFGQIRKVVANRKNHD